MLPSVSYFSRILGTDDVAFTAVNTFVLNYMGLIIGKTY